MTAGFGLEKVPTTEGWTWLVFISCIANFICLPVFIFMLIQIKIATSQMKEDYHPPFHQRAIFITSFGYFICLLISSACQFTTFSPSRWNITPSQDICDYVKRSDLVLTAFTHYFFYQFCLLRIRNVFEVSPKLRLRPWQFIAFQIIIHGYLIYHGIIFQILIQMQPHPIFGFCYAIEKHSDIHVGIFIIWDAITVIFLIYMFSSRLICGMQTDHDSSEALSRFKTKTLILGIIATFSSLMVTVLFILGRMNRFVFNLDGFVNACCVMFTFNMRYVSFPSLPISKPKCCKHECTKKRGVDEGKTMMEMQSSVPEV
eukprot:263887_1